MRNPLPLLLVVGTISGIIATSQAAPLPFAPMRLTKLESAATQSFDRMHNIIRSAPLTKHFLAQTEQCQTSFNASKQFRAASLYKLFVAEFLYAHQSDPRYSFSRTFTPSAAAYTQGEQD